jgi:hypothetical protein
MTKCLFINKITDKISFYLNGIRVDILVVIRNSPKNKKKINNYE